MDLTKLSEEMLQQGYLAENLSTDEGHHRFSIDGHKGQPGYYCIRKTVSGLSAVYGDFISGKKYVWTSDDNHKDLSSEENIRVLFL